MANKGDRVFIVGPSDYGMSAGDSLYLICTTSNHRNSILDIYQMDDYDDYEGTDNLKDAMAIAKRRKIKLFSNCRIIVI